LPTYTKRLSATNKILSISFSLVVTLS